MFSEEVYSSSHLVPIGSFGMYDVENEFEDLDNAYNSVKFINHVHYTNYLGATSTYATGNQYMSYIQVLNSLQTNYSESIISADEYPSVGGAVGDDLDLSPNYDLRTSNPVKLRPSAKSSIAGFNALQKVFRARLDEGRSSVRFPDLSNSTVKYPLLLESRAPYNTLLGKNKEGFYQTNAYKALLADHFSLASPLLNSLNIYFSDLPFLTSNYSDVIRFLWFD
jgi:hypothetical protein